MLQRTLSTLALWTLVFVCLRYLGPLGGVWLLTGAGLLALHEFYAMVRRLGVQPFNRLGLVFGAAILLAPRYGGAAVGATELLALAVIVCSLRILGERGPQDRVDTLVWTLFGLLYVPFMLQFLVRIVLIAQPRGHTGLVLALWLVVVTKFCDTGALLTGLAFGRHKLAPEISPKKTWEGVAGGLLIAVACGVGLAAAARAHLPAGLTPAFAAALAVPVAALAIVSDLVESIIKRHADTKDTGRVIPGIGGMFDLVDSLILTAPLGWAVFHLL